MQAFQKGSPIAADFSRVILLLSEEGKLKPLEEKWFTPLPECSTSATDDNIESLSLHSFKGVYIISSATSTICFLVFLIRSVKRANRGNVSASSKSVSMNRQKSGSLKRGPSFARGADGDEWSSSKWEYVSTSDTQEKPLASSPAEIEMP